MRDAQTKKPSRRRFDPILQTWSALQTNLARAVVDASHHLEAASSVAPESSRGYAFPLTPAEMARFRAAWSADPIRCIRAMNEAIGLLPGRARRQRYMDAAVELEIAMDRELNDGQWGRDLVGLPHYLPDGYTDYGVPASARCSRRRERIVVDKEGLRSELIAAKSEAVDAMSRNASADLETSLRDHAVRLRTDLDYHETEEEGVESDDTLRLSDRLACRRVSRRHLAILYQLRLQEAGLTSTMTKGVVRLFSLKVRHTWNVVRQGDTLALVDVGFADETSPLVLVGRTLSELDDEAARRHRTYSPSPESGNRYRIRPNDDPSDATATVW